MSVSQEKRKAIENAVRAKKCSDSCIASKFHVSVDEVRKIAKPLRQKWYAQNKAKRELDKITEEAWYDRKPYHDNQATCPEHGSKCSALAQAIAVFIVVCVLVLLLCFVIVAGKWALGI